MAIPQHTIDQILDRTDIVDLIGQRVKLKKSGRTYSGCCPFHQEKSPSFHVYRDKQYSTVLVVRPMVMPFVF